MAVDSTFNDTDTSSDETKDQPPSLAPDTPSALKPPRPAKRPGAFARVPMPDSFNPPSSGMPRSIDDAAPASPASGVPERDDGPEFPLTAQRAKAPAAAASEPRAFASAPSDQAPSPPVTPWATVPAMVSAPPVRVEADAYDSSPPVGVEPEDEREDDREQTIVGEVPRRLLEMSSSGDENTRAYTAPQELIELARRKREERLKAKAFSVPVGPVSAEAHVRETERPPARRAPLESIPEESFEDVMPDDPPLPAGMLAAADDDAAPAIERPASGPPELGVRPNDGSTAPKAPASTAPNTPLSGAPRTPASTAPNTPLSGAPRAPASAAPSTPLTGAPRTPVPSLARSAVSLPAKGAPSAAPPVTNSMMDRAYGSAPAASEAPRAAVAQSSRRSEPAPVSAEPPASTGKTSWFSGVPRWLIVIGLFIALGMVLARWRGLERFFLH